MKQIVFDIEANGFEPDTLWCIAAYELDRKQMSWWVGDDMLAFNDWIKGHGDCEVIGHNILGYDIPVLEKLLGTDFSKCKVTDTLVMSRLANPQRHNGHSLENWGTILGQPKGDYSDFTTYSPAMLDYCKQDVSVNVLVYQRLLLELADFGAESISLEHQVQSIILQQVKAGWLLDQEKAFLLLAELKEKKYDLEDEVHKTFKPLPTFVKEITPKIKKDGTYSVVGLKFLGDDWDTAVAPFSRIDFPEFNLGSRQQIGRYLQYFGWKPKKFTETGQAIVDEAVLSTVTGIPQASLIGEYLMIQKRIAQVQSWVEAVKEDGRVHGYVNPNGAVTGRMTHSSPNMGQVPAVYSPYGKQCRDVWTVPEGYKLVGMDASGLELRMLAHYMNDEAYTNEILNGDIHTANQLAAGLETRDQAKTFIYAFLYGAGDSKIGSIVGGTKRDGKRLKEKFLANTPALGQLRERVGVAAGRGFVYGLDRRRVSIRSEHAALNSLLQSAGAIVMKKALCLLHEYAILWGIDFNIIGNIHDEIQTEVRQEKAEVFGRLATSCVEAAGLFTNSTAPLRETTKLEIVGQTHTDCTECGVTLTEHNWADSFAKRGQQICKSCFNTKHNKQNGPNRMWVNGKYIPKSHPLYKAGRYKGFEEAAFSSLENFKDNPQGQVYVIANPAWKDWVKVGMAVDATDRAGNYQTSSPYRDYTLLYTYDVDDRRAAESAAHTRLAKECDNINEWFRLPPETANDLILEVIHEY